MASEAKRIGMEMAEDVKAQLQSRIDGLQVALECFQSHVAARFDAVDQRSDALEREVRSDLKAIDRRFEQLERRLGRMTVQFDSLHTCYTSVITLLVIPFALAILAGVGSRPAARHRAAGRSS